MCETRPSDDVIVRELKRLVVDRNFYCSLGNPKNDEAFYETQDIRIAECIRMLEGSDHIFVRSIKFISWKANYVI